ncbi:MAG: PEP-CTERM sorting domain-containing protein [Deltaproteobacteria bacterium]|nr:PEP-CTERM sorting domain-containing protein [Deltaproteobacteria bacterium]
MAFKRFLVSGLLSIAGLCSLAPTAGATATYAYTGNNYTTASGELTTSMRLELIITLAQPLQPDTFTQPTILAYSAFNGVRTLSSAQIQTSGPEFQVTTDGAGIPIGWSFDARTFETTERLIFLAVLSKTTQSPTDVVRATFDQRIDLGAATSTDPGTWMLVPIPEPNTALLMGLGLLGLSVRNRRED